MKERKEVAEIMLEAIADIIGRHVPDLDVSELISMFLDAFGLEIEDLADYVRESEK